MLQILKSAGEITRAIVTHKVGYDSSTSLAKSPDLKDPFKKDSIRKVQVVFQDFWSNGVWKADGYIDFKEGNTSGQQKFDGTSIEDVLEKMAAFVKTL